MLIKPYIFIKLKVLSLIALLTIGFYSCDFLYDEGDWSVEKRSVGSFSKLDIECIADVYFHKSEDLYIEVSYYENQIQDISTNIEAGSLIINNEFGGEWFTDIRLPRIDVYAPKLSKVAIDLAGSFYCIDTIVADTFKLDLLGDVFESDLLINARDLSIKANYTSGILNIYGQSKKATVQNIGNAKIEAAMLRLNSLKIIQKSSLDAVFQVHESLEYKIIRNGDLLVYGNPAFISGEDLGDGNLILKNEN